MNTKLNNITTQYRKFNDNQVLTEGQLNEFLDYFEGQDRLSRTRLSGVGVVCGFKSTYLKSLITQANTQANSEVNTKEPDLDIFEEDDTKAIQPIDNSNAIVITQGSGVTTDGDLITLRKKGDGSSEITVDFKSQNYKYYRNYIDEVKYEHFRIGDKQIPLLELITQEEYNQLKAEGFEVSGFSEVRTIEKVNDKIIILYLESYSNEESPCKDADCDNTGSEQVSNLKVLLADSQSVSDLFSKGNAKDSLYKIHNAYEELFDKLPNIEAKRVILDPAITTALQLKTKFKNAIGAVSDLSNGFSAIASTFKVSVNLGGQSLVNKLNSILNSTAPGLEDYQYRYDFLKDLIDTYNEIKGLILHLNVECCPNISSFPKHLMLGPVGASLQLGENTSFRHGFYSSPINTNDDENYERVIMLAYRFVEKIKGFQSYIGSIKITPSNLNVWLGNKAIPYYYNVNKPLLDKWSFEKTKTNRETYNLSYHTTNLAKEDFVQNSLNYNIDNNDFYRIEGHLGLPYKTALQNINNLKKRYGLAFDVIALVLQKSNASIGEVVAEAEIESVIKIETKTVSVDDLIKQLVAISDDISNQNGDSQSTLQTISNLDNQLRLLNKVESTGGDIAVIKEDPKKEKIVSELFSDFLERKSGLEHLAGVEPGGTFVLIAESERNNKVLADFSLPYLCCSKKDPVFLVLPASQLCQNDAPVKMTVVPLDGEVKAFVNGVQISNAIIKTPSGEKMFNPRAITTQFDLPITFTVNDDSVDAKMVVHAEPNIIIKTNTPVNGEDPINPTATVMFSVSGDNLSDFNYSWSFGDGQSVSVKKPASKANRINQSYTYSLVAGQEQVFNPVLTVSNDNGCSRQFIIEPIKLKGQSLVQCLSSLEIIVQYNEALGPCPGGHRCNNATFNLMANGLHKIGDVNLNNSSDTLEPGQFRPNNETTGPNRINAFQISQTDAQAIAATDPNGTGFISFSLVCSDANCHGGVAWTTLKLGGVVIYDGCPNNNFLTINPCTGEIKP